MRNDNRTVRERVRVRGHPPNSGGYGIITGRSEKGNNDGGVRRSEIIVREGATKP